MTLNISRQKRRNLAKLAKWLITHAAEIDFDMRTFTSDGSEPGEIRHNCGTVACAAGHGPLAGIEPLKDEDWGEYAERCFTMPVDKNKAAEEALFDFLFATPWRYVDNTAQGAGHRILWTLEHGLPENWLDQVNGDAELSYV